MPLDTVRLIDSDLFALSTGEEFKAAVALWCKSWTQVPAASLPDDDRILSYLSGTASRWKRVKAMVMRGWVRCDDGRFYHPVIAEKALEAWEERKEYRDRQDNETTRLQNFRAEHKALRDALRGFGVVMPFDAKITELRARLDTLERNKPETKPETPPETILFQDGNACNAPAMAKTGTGTGTGIYQEQKQKPSPSSSSAGQPARDDDDQPVPGEQDLPAWVPKPLWREFYRHRVVIRKPLSIPGQRQVVARLIELSEAGHDIASSLRQTMAAGLAIPVEPRNPATGPPNGRQPSDSKTLTALKKLQGLKTDETLSTRVAAERNPGRLIETRDAEP
jgi:hypothetical protein